MHIRKFIIEFWCWEVKIELYGEKNEIYRMVYLFGQTGYEKL